MVIGNCGITAFANSKGQESTEKEMTPEFSAIVEENEKTEDDSSEETFEINEFELISDL